MIFHLFSISQRVSKGNAIPYEDFLQMFLLQKFSLSTPAIMIVVFDWILFQIATPSKPQSLLNTPFFDHGAHQWPASSSQSLHEPHLFRTYMSINTNCNAWLPSELPFLWDIWVNSACQLHGSFDPHVMQVPLLLPPIPSPNFSSALFLSWCHEHYNQLQARLNHKF